MTREEQVSHILAEVAGGRALSRIIREDADMPGHSTFWRWHMADEALRDNLARARDNGVEHYVDECVDIADGPKADAVEVQHAKLRIETRLKYAAMIKPRKYGPKMDVTSEGKRIEGLAVSFVTPGEQAEAE